MRSNKRTKDRVREVTRGQRTEDLGQSTGDREQGAEDRGGEGAELNHLPRQVHRDGDEPSLPSWTSVVQWEQQVQWEFHIGKLVLPRPVLVLEVEWRDVHRQYQPGQLAFYQRDLGKL